MHRVLVLLIKCFLLFVCSVGTAQAADSSTINDIFGQVNGAIATLLFFDVFWFTDAFSVPFAVLWLVIGSIIFSIWMGFINVRGFVHAINITRGCYDDPNDVGEVSHFQALMTALSATVGLGNIAGVAIAVSIGGPGAVFWMLVAGFLGMNAKFVECTLAQMYREVRSDGHIMGGPMEYISRGFKEKGMEGLGKWVAMIFAMMCIGGSFGGGTSFQVNQSFNQIASNYEFFADKGWLYGLIMSGLVATVIIGGITRIAHAAEKIVPTMCGLYVLACLIVIFTHITKVPWAVGVIVSEAFNFDSAYGGFIGVLVTGFQRAAFSNEAGVGSAPIAHAAARTKHPVREGFVAALEPFIDTILVCSMTALVIVITGAYDSSNPAFADYIATKNGAGLTSEALGSVISWFPHILSIAVVLFAFSTMISWSYYGERCWSYLFTEKTAIIYRMLVCLVVFLGAITTSTNVLEFGDLMILGMAIPNVFGVYFLAGNVKKALNDYLKRLDAGEFTRHK